MKTTAATKKPSTDQELTKKELIAKLKALGKISIQTKREIVCALIGHSRIVDFFWGYVDCGRCGHSIGDNLGGSYDNKNNVVVGHDCDICRENAKTLTWQDRYLAPDPFKNSTDENTKAN